MSEHHEYSPSGAPRLVRCVGSHFLESKFEDRGSKDADDGTASHELAKTCLRTGTPAAKHIGTAITLVNDDGSTRGVYIVDAERAGFVQIYIDQVHERIENYRKAGATHVELRVEEKINVGQATGIDGQFGTGDAVLIAYFPEQKIKIEIIDLKYGRGVKVDAFSIEDTIQVGHEQLLLYGVGTLVEVDLVGDVVEVTLTIVQPRIGHVSEHRTTPAELRDFAALYVRKAMRSQKIYADGGVEPDDLVPGEKQCKFCRAKATCPALKAVVEEATLADFDDLSKPIGCASATHDELANKMSLVGLIEDWCKGVRSEVERRLFNGIAVPGFKLVEGRRGNRAWKDEDEVLAMFKSMRLKHEQMYDYSLISPTTAEKLAKAGAIGDRQWTKVLEKITQPKGKNSVAPESDKRPAVTPVAAEHEFEDLTQE